MITATPSLPVRLALAHGQENRAVFLPLK